MKPPCEIVVWYVIPAIRSQLAKNLLKLGMKQKLISELMDITQPAVSQYCTDKRGSEIVFSSEVKKLIADFAKDLYDGTAVKNDIIAKTCFICKRIKAEDVICQLHKNKSHISSECKACLGSEYEAWSI
jgi:predicted transcriptional regulator